MIFAEIIPHLSSPVILSFVLGLVACRLQSDLKIPESLYQGLSIYLLFAIGLKGGAAIQAAGPARLAFPALGTLFLGVATPLAAYALMKTLGRLDRPHSAAVAAHYGSVSAVTFLVGLEAASKAGLSPEPFLPALVALLEIPGIVVALCLARSSAPSPAGAFREVLTGKSILLLLGGTLIGFAAPPEQFREISPFFIAPFKGALCLFLLELGLIAGRHLGDFRQAGLRPVATAILISLLHAPLGVAIGLASGLQTGGAAILGLMAASASYIAAPAAVRLALPQASPGIYLTLALGVTFPFNLLLGIPWCLFLSRTLSTQLHF